MKPLLYHLEYHLENGYFDRFPKGQAIKMVVGNDGGVQTLYGRGTGSGKVMVSSGKSVLFAMDKSKEELKVVFRAYSDDKLIGEAVKIFKETSFPKRTEVGEPASYTFGSDLSFRKGTELVGAIKSFIRMTSFGENITSDCIKDGESYRVRMTSLIVERNKDPRKNVKPWWVILDGRRLRFSRWLRALEKEDCAKDVFLNVKKCSDVGNLPSISEAPINKEEIAAFESAEAALKKDFDFIREFGSQATFDKGSQVDLSIDPSFYGFQLSSYIIKSNEKCCCGQNKISTTSSIQADSPTFEKESEVKNSFGETVLSSEKQPSITPSPNSQIKESEFFVNEHDKNSQNQQNTNDLICLDFNQTNDNDCDTNISEQKKRNHESNVKNYKKTKADEIFHFERSTSDLFGENASTGSSGMKSLISEEIGTSDCEVETPIVTEKSFLAETIVREIIDVIIESVFEREYRSLEEHALDELVTATKEDSDNKVVRVVGYGDTESLMDLSVLGVVKTSACVDLSKPKNHNVTSNRSTTSFDENEEDNEEQHSPKTILICSNQMQKERSDEECSSKNFRENQYIRTNDLRQESDVSCILIKCNDQSDLEDLHYCRPRENSVGSCSVRNESNEGLSDAQLYHKNMAGYRKPTRGTVDHCVSEWVKEDVITPCFTCDEETKDDMIHRERWRRTIITNDTCFVGSAESSCLPRPEDECRPEIIYSSDELQSVQLMSSNAYHSTHAESESNSSFQDKVSTTNTLVSQLTNDRSQEIKFMEEFQGNAKTSELIDPDFILKNKRRTSSSSASDNEFSSSEHAQQK